MFAETAAARTLYNRSPMNYDILTISSEGKEHHNSHLHQANNKKNVTLTSPF